MAEPTVVVRREPRPAAATPVGVVIPGLRDLTVIGSGGFSTVYRAWQDRFSRTVAIKILDLDLGDVTSRRRFERECALTGRLTGHPNIVTVLESGFTSDDRPFLVMEHLDRGSLDKRMKEHGVIDVDEVLRIGVKIAGALETAHRIDVLHRDIKPSNILMSRYDEPALADFGIATVTQGANLHSTADALTPLHAAPEVLEGKPPSVASDLYSLGSTLYTLLAGRPPFGDGEGEGLVPFLARIMDEEVPDIARPDVPASVVELLRSVMAKRAEDRPASALELAERLRQLQSHFGQTETDFVVPRGDELGFFGPPPGTSLPPLPEQGPIVDLGHLSDDVRNNNRGIVVTIDPGGAIGARGATNPVAQPTATFAAPPAAIHAKHDEGPPWVLFGVAMGAVVVIVVAVVLAVSGGDDNQRAGTTPATLLVPPSDLVVDDATNWQDGVELTWEGDERATYEVKIYSRAGGDEPVPSDPVPERGAMTVFIGAEQLDEETGYCFVVANEESMATERDECVGDLDWSELGVPSSGEG